MGKIRTAPEDPLYRVSEAADYVKMSESWLNKARCSGTGPKFVRMSPSRVAYRRSDLDAWLRSRTFESTAAADAADRAA